MKTNSQLNETSEVIMVLGMHRSGTSVIAHALETIGVFLGSNLLGPSKDNAKGYYENRSVVILNDFFLKQLGGTWNSLTLEKISPEHLPGYVSSLRDLLNKEFSDNPLVGIKDPRLIKVYPIWARALSERNVSVKHVLALRHPYSVASSLTKRDQIHCLVGLLLWLQHTVDSLKTIRKGRDLIVSYDNILADPASELARIALGLNIAPSQNSSRAAIFANQFIDKELNHNSENRLQEKNYADLTSVCIKTYEDIHFLASNDDISTDSFSNLVADTVDNVSSFWRRYAGTLEQISDLHSFHQNHLNHIFEENQTILKSEKEHYTQIINKLNADNKELKRNLEWLEVSLKNRVARYLKKRLMLVNRD